MVKKRQNDFPKNQLRPGRSVAKRANLTSVKFKTRKIVVTKEKIKIKAESTVMEYIKKIKGNGSEKEKSTLLDKLCTLIDRQTDSLNDYLPHIFDVVFNYIKDPNDNVRNNALKVIKAVLGFTTDLQLHCFSDLICKNITTFMKNPNPEIVPVSLTLLNAMLEHHPALICHNTTILFDLLPTERKHYTRKIVTNEKEKSHYSENNEINALGHINVFIKNILLLRSKKDHAQNEREDDNIICMDKKAIVPVVLYAGGGLQPVDIEEAFAAQFNPRMDPFKEIEDLIPCIDALLKYIPIYFCQIINKESNADDNSFRSEPISDLSVLIQLLCDVAELAEELSYHNAPEEITDFLKEKVFSSQRKRFPFELLSAMYDAKLQHLALLNASLCYLHMKYLSSDENFDGDEILIERYIKKFFGLEKTFTSEIKCQCIPYFIKMIQLYEYKTDVPAVIYHLLNYLVVLLKTSRVSHSNKKILMKFLLDMSLLPGYKFWIETEPMKTWYGWLMGQLKDTAELDITIMKMICKIAKLRHPSFIELLDFDVLKCTLKKGSDVAKETAILMLHNMDINNELLKNIYDLMCLESFMKKFGITVIHMLNVRFNQYPANKRPYVDYIEFLLNIAIDVSSFSKSRMIDVEANDYTTAVQVIQNRHPFCIVPSLQWQEHSKLFEVCLRYLRNLPMAPVRVMFMKVVEELLHPSRLIPMHCALAILKLDMLESNESNQDHHRLMRDLNFSCLLTTSVLTQISLTDEWYKWNVCELIKSMSLTADSALHIVELLDQGNFGIEEPDGIVVYHIFRVLKVFVERNLLDYENEDIVELLVQVMTSLAEEQCTDKTMKLQPLFKQVYTFFENHYCG